jgi:hypothetical protein
MDGDIPFHYRISSSVWRTAISLTTLPADLDTNGRAGSMDDVHWGAISRFGYSPFFKRKSATIRVSAPELRNLIKT